MIDYIEDETIKLRITEAEYKRRLATAAALAHCPSDIQEWLIEVTGTSERKEACSYNDFYGAGDVEWFEVGHNASHYFSLGIRKDGGFIQKISGPEYDEDCQCWYEKTTVSVVTVEDIRSGYWGHQ